LLGTYSAFVTTTVSSPLRTVTVPLTVVPWKEPDTATGVSAVTARALRPKVAVVAPGLTETLAGSAMTSAFALAKLTTTPSAAGPLNVTVPTAGLPPKELRDLPGRGEYLSGHFRRGTAQNEQQTAQTKRDRSGSGFHGRFPPLLCKPGNGRTYTYYYGRETP
jgi:hypothetical protein